MGNTKKHELIGKYIEVIDSDNKSHIGIKGKVIDETRFMLVIESDKGKVKKLPKKQIVIIIKKKIKNNAKDNAKVKIKGLQLIGRPEERLKD